MHRIIKANTVLAVIATLLPIGWFGLAAISILAESPLSTTNNWFIGKIGVYSVFAAFWAAPVLIALGFGCFALLHFRFHNKNDKIYFRINLACSGLWLAMLSLLRYIPD